MAYRDRDKFTRLPESIVPYKDEDQLLRFLAAEFRPGARPGLGAGPNSGSGESKR